jgi:multiple sugar transport system permease protein
MMVSSTLAQEAPAATPRRAPRGRQAPTDLGTKAFNRFAATCLVLFALIWLVPFVWAIITSLRTDNDITAHPVSFWTNQWSWGAYTSTMAANPIGWWYLNSFLISTLSVIFTVVVCSMIAFALAHLQFRGRAVLLGVVFLGIMVPTEALVLPQFIEFRSLGMIGTYWGVILPAVASPVAVFVFHAFIKQVPISLIEAARIDGASWWRIYRQVVMPLVKSATSAVAILTFIQTWNAFLWPLLVLMQTRSQTVTVGLAGLVGGSAIQFAETMASAVLGFLPLIAVFLVLQRQITEGVAQTGIK